MSTLSVSQARAESGRDRKTIYSWIESGELKAEKVQREAGRSRWAIDRESWEALLTRVGDNYYARPHPLGNRKKHKVRS